MPNSLPNINIRFESEAVTAFTRGERGTVGLILLDTNLLGAHTLLSDKEMPVGLTPANEDLIKKTFIGNTNTPRKVELFILDSANVVLSDALNHFENTDFSLIAFPDADATQTQDIVTFISFMNSSLGIGCQGVVFNNAADNESIINVTQTDTNYTPAQLVARTVGLIAGTSLDISTTYTQVNDIEPAPMSRADVNTAITDGKFIYFKDKGKTKVARGINSLTSISQSTPESFQKILIVSIKDIIRNDITYTIKDSYIGKFKNSYLNKLVLINAIDGYLSTLATDELIEPTFTVQIDLEAQKNYLKSRGMDITDMSDQEILEANTDDKVFLLISVKILDVVEEVFIKILV